jgi:hypothetical protein
MGIDISRGIAALKSAWGFDSTEAAGETNSSAGESLSAEFLAEAQSYLTMGRHQSAAILAGDALEDALRTMCKNFSIALPTRPTVDSMNAQLAKLGVYDVLMEQRLAEMNELWDKANSGLWSEVSKSGVEKMLGEIRAFVSQHVVD